MPRPFIALLCALLLAGCARPPADACQLLAIAMEEGDFAEAWYIEAGQVLVRCGIPNAAEVAASKACAARRFNDSRVECK